MFGFFKQKSQLDQLHEKYRKLMEKHYTLSKVNRTLSDQVYAEADAVLQEIERLSK